MCYSSLDPISCAHYGKLRGVSKVATSGKLEPFPVSLGLRAAASGLKTNRRTKTEAILGLFVLGSWALEENWKRSCNILCYNMHM